MKYLIIFLSACLLAMPAFAQTQRIPDLSLTPEETIRQSQDAPDEDDTQPISGSGPVSGFGNSKEDDEGAAPNNVPKAGTFMQGYCDQDFKPAIGISGALQSCLENARKQTCDRFRTLPPDAARALDHAIGCAYAASESPDDPPGPGCDTIDARRLRLIQRYWSDQNTAYTLVFLPDMILNASNYCLPGGKN